MTRRIRYKQLDQLTIADAFVYSQLPRHPFFDNIESKIDFSFADRLCSVLYTGRGPYPYAPSLKLKVHLVQLYYNLSDRLTEEKIIGDLFVKRFLGVSVDFFGFDHSTIGLDRGRMGPAMFQACHLYILAQMLSHKLWGDKNEQWIIDSFPCHVHAVRPGAYRLIQQAMLRFLNLLKRHFPDAFTSAESALDVNVLIKRIPRNAEERERLLAFSRLVAEAYALLEWFEGDQAIRLICSNEEKARTRERLYEMRSVLERILTEYTRELQTDGQADGGNDPSGNRPEETISSSGEEATLLEPASPPCKEETVSQDKGTPLSETEEIRYEKIPLASRPKDRIVSAAHPDVRVGMKKASLTIVGFKNQVLCTTGGVVLNTRVIPALEHDRDAMADMLREVGTVFRQLPSIVLGDTAYGHGKQRAILKDMGIEVAAPVPPTQNPKGLFDIAQFTYQKDKDVFICPQGKKTVRKLHNAELNGTQYYFEKKDCHECPLRDACTTRKKGRTVFLSDYYELYEKAKAFNATDEGAEASRSRYEVERKNQELKNDCGLGSPKVTRKSALSIKASLSAIVVNLKLVVRKLMAPKPGFLRRTRVQPN